MSRRGFSGSCSTFIPELLHLSTSDARIGSTMSSDLSRLRDTLIRGQKLSGQGSYERRQPSTKAVPFLLEARLGLREYVRVHERESEAWHLLSLAEESLLNYENARTSLERAIALSQTQDRRYLKRLALLREYEARWQGLRLSPQELSELGDYLRGNLPGKPCDHTLRHTLIWLKDRKVSKPSFVIQALQNQGGFCDCEVLCNAVMC